MQIIADTHFSIINEASNYGIKAIYCEKPISETLYNTDRMIEICEKKGILLVINHHRRFDKFYQIFRDFIQREGLGSIQTVTIYYTRGITNTCSHAFDLLRYLLGDAEWVCADYSKSKSCNQEDPNFDGMIRFKNGTIVSLQACDDQNYVIFELDFLAAKYRIRIGKEFEYFKVVKGKNILGLNELEKCDDWPLKEKPNSISLIPGVEHIVNCLDGKEKLVSAGIDGRRALELICAFHESAKSNGKRIYLPLMESSIKIKSK